MTKRYSRYTHKLHSLQKDDRITLQNHLNWWWNIMSKVITVLPDHQYKIRVDGPDRIMLRNHHFLRKLEFQTISTHIPSVLLEPTVSPSDNLVTHSNPPIPASNDTNVITEHSKRDTYMPLIHTTHVNENFLSPIQITSA